MKTTWGTEWWSLSPLASRTASSFPIPTIGIGTITRRPEPELDNFCLCQWFEIFEVSLKVSVPRPRYIAKLMLLNACYKYNPTQCRWSIDVSVCEESFSESTTWSRNLFPLLSPIVSARRLWCRGKPGGGHCGPGRRGWAGSGGSESSQRLDPATSQSGARSEN